VRPAAARTASGVDPVTTTISGIPAVVKVRISLERKVSA
jgi:hypothetical protein